MSEFALHQALDSSSESDETEIKSRCFGMSEGEDEIFSLDEGLTLVVSHRPKTMQHLATLVLTMNRMKKSLARCRELSGDQLCSEIMSNMVEETIVKNEGTCTAEQRRYTYQRGMSLKEFTLSDSSKKNLCQVSGQLKLQAVSLKGGQHEQKVNFKLVPYTPTTRCNKPQTVILSIMNKNLHISSSLKGGKAVLNLEEYSEENLKSISDDGDMDRFLFYKTAVGLNVSKFESVKCPGWFISTSYADEYQPVDMCQLDCAGRNMTFSILKA